MLILIIYMEDFEELFERRAYKYVNQLFKIYFHENATIFFD